MESAGIQLGSDDWSFHVGWYDKLVVIVSALWLVGAFILLLRRRNLPSSDAAITLAMMPALLGLANAWLALRNIGRGIRVLDSQAVLPLAPEMVVLFSALFLPTGAALAIACLGLSLPGRDQKPTSWVTKVLIGGTLLLSVGLMAVVVFVRRSGFVSSMPLFGAASAMAACLSVASAGSYWLLRFSGRRSRRLEASVVLLLACLFASVVGVRSYFLAQLS